MNIDTNTGTNVFHFIMEAATAHFLQILATNAVAASMIVYLNHCLQGVFK